jgi:hypothetical protein
VILAGGLKSFCLVLSSITPSRPGRYYRSYYAKSKNRFERLLLPGNGNNSHCSEAPENSKACPIALSSTFARIVRSLALPNPPLQIGRA